MSDWRLAGKCSNLPNELADKIFFLGQGGSPKRARLFCATCPVLTACRDYAILYNEEGIWGGMTKDERDCLNWLQPALEQRAREAGLLEARPEPITSVPALSQPLVSHDELYYDTLDSLDRLPADSPAFAHAHSYNEFDVNPSDAGSLTA